MEFIPLCCVRETLAKGTRDRWKMTMKSKPENQCIVSHLSFDRSQVFIEISAKLALLASPM